MEFSQLEEQKIERVYLSGLDLLERTKYIFFTNAQNDYYIEIQKMLKQKAKAYFSFKNDVSHQILTNLGIKNLKVSEDKSSKEKYSNTVAKTKSFMG